MPTTLGRIEDVPMAEEFGDTALGAAFMKKFTGASKKMMAGNSGAAGKLTGGVAERVAGKYLPPSIAKAVGGETGKFTSNTLASLDKKAPAPKHRPIPSPAPAPAPVAAVPTKIEEIKQAIVEAPIVKKVGMGVGVLALVAAVVFFIWKSKQAKKA
jgi:hypothetical protein